MFSMIILSSIFNPSEMSGYGGRSSFSALGDEFSSIWPNIFEETKSHLISIRELIAAVT